MNKHAPPAGPAALVLVGGLLAGAPPAAAATTTFPFAASQDSYVSSSSPTRNFNDTASLVVGATPTRTSYLQFNITRLTDPVTSARLRLHVQNTPTRPARTAAPRSRSAPCAATPGTSWTSPPPSPATASWRSP
uniref:CBM96 family carbohydrate-binding protein n=1 Tax=Micromonospora auratinigra TaxID=261654 RepID=UPI0012FDFC8F|nr:DNRLRE domain-containing protein [Micromonospora auratinigra]